MTPAKDINTSLNKIKSIIFNMAQERRITSEELDDFNNAAAKAFDAVDDFVFLLRKNNHELQAATAREKNTALHADKLWVMLVMLGLKPQFIEHVMQMPYRFLQTINKALRKHNQPIEGDHHFEMIMQRYRWFMHMVERDMRNIETVKLQKKLYASEHPEVRHLALTIMEQITKESLHIVFEIKSGKTPNELKTKIENHWYEQLSTHNPCR